MSRRAGGCQSARGYAGDGSLQDARASSFQPPQKIGCPAAFELRTLISSEKDGRCSYDFCVVAAESDRDRNTAGRIAEEESHAQFWDRADGGEPGMAAA